MYTTICAIATAPGGAIGIVRISGEKAISIASSIFKPAKGPALTERKTHTLTYGNILTSTGEVIDEVLVSLMRAPHSYTGEDCVEISCHASSYILAQVMQLLIQAGCQTAQPGEFTQRAFLNGKMDLSQAEAVADLIASTTAANHRMAIHQLRGGFSKELHELRERLLHLTSLMELELDFSDHEDLEFADRTELLTLASQTESHIGRLCQSFKLGNALKRGLPVAIVGETNAGKSTLLNALLGEERALVSDIHGTTRDTVEECINMDGTLIRFIDTAGIRHTSDVVEQMGIRRTFTKMDEAEVVIWMVDATQAETQFTALAPDIARHIDGKQLVIVLNKADLLPHPTIESYRTTSPFPEAQMLLISAQSTEGVDRLRHILSQTISSLTASHSPEDTIVSNARHYEALTQARTALLRVIDGLHSGLSGDFISQDLRECLHYLGSIIGEISSNDVLHNIFKHFCVGK